MKDGRNEENRRALSLTMSRKPRSESFLQCGEDLLRGAEKLDGLPLFGLGRTVAPACRATDSCLRPPLSRVDQKTGTPRGSSADLIGSAQGITNGVAGVCRGGQTKQKPKMEQRASPATW